MSNAKYFDKKYIMDLELMKVYFKECFTSVSNMHCLWLIFYNPENRTQES